MSVGQRLVFEKFEDHWREGVPGENCPTWTIGKERLTGSQLAASGNLADPILVNQLFRGGAPILFRSKWTFVEVQF